MATETNGSGGIWPKTAAAEQVKSRLADEKTLMALDSLLTKMETLEKAVDDLSVLMKRGPGMVAMGADMLDEAYRRADEQGVSIDERLHTALQLAERLTDPAMVAKIDSMLQLADRFPGIVAMMMDMMDEQLAPLAADGLDLQKVASVAGEAGVALSITSEEPANKIGGIFGLFRSLRDPDRQRALGFVMRFLKHFGRRLA